MDTIRRRLLVHGRVQGVFFRDSTRDRARRDGVAGWARNCPDGTVEVVLEGGPDAVARVAAFCERGPRGAQVERIEASDERSEGLHGFEIR
jgi:acylphosphatase